MILIDGSFGEGGGQILRTSLALSAVTRRPIRIENIRAGRSRPGLQRQHLTAVNAAVKICRAKVKGNVLDSMELEFHPGPVVPGDYRFPVGSAGSTGLVLQTVLPPLMVAEGASRLHLEGGTHNPWAPPFHFLRDSFVPILNSMGPTVDMKLERFGFYPVGGGQVRVRIHPQPKLQPISLMERGELVSTKAWAFSAKIRPDIGKREMDLVARRLGWNSESCQALDVPSFGPGNAVVVELEFENITNVFTGFGKKGKPLEKVVDEVVRQVEAFLRSDVPVDEHLADQLLLPMALAGGGEFITSEPTEHARTNLEIIRKFLDVEMELERIDGPRWSIRCRAA